MSSAVEHPTYIAYILRCWSEGSAWRYSLEELGNGKRYGFASIDDFVSFLLALSTEPQRKVDDSLVDGDSSRMR